MPENNVISFLTGQPFHTPDEIIAHHRATADFRAAQNPLISGWKNMGVIHFLEAVCDDPRLPLGCPIIDALMDVVEENSNYSPAQ